MFTSLLSFALLAASPNASPDLLSTGFGDLGEIYQFSTNSGQFDVTNHSDRPISISVEPVHSTDKVLRAPKVLDAHATEQVKVSVTPLSEAGLRIHSFAVRIAGETSVAAYGQMRGFVVTALDDVSPVIDFGVVDSHANAPLKEVRLASREDPSLTISSVLAAPEFAEVKISEDRRSLRASIKGNTDWGVKDNVIKLALNSRKQSQVWVEVRADIHGDIVPLSNPFDFGVARKGQKNQYLIRLDKRDGTDFKISNVSLENFQGEVGHEECAPPRSGCEMLKLHISDDQPTGKLNGRILVKFSEMNHVLPINVGGMLFPANVTIADLNEEMQKQSENRRTDLSSALKEAAQVRPAPIVMPTPPGAGPLLKWRVQNERTLYGYIVYRSESEGGPMTRVDDRIIRALSNEDGTSVEYRWRDASAKPQHTYWYQISTINLRGVRSDLSGPVKKIYTADEATAK